MMAEYTSFKLPSGVVHVQSNLTPPATGPFERASGVDEKARETWEGGIDLVRELAEGIIANLKSATTEAKEVEVEFGVNISGKTGIILVEGTVEANLKVTVKW